ncbi:MAG TPA: extracellular solute-binding protein [Candidatus Sulfotelmatobacter sp.]|nr:extracellular solute-binding protein [Candidatus Sulfotelmatobacter sp.]
MSKHLRWFVALAVLALLTCLVPAPARSATELKIGYMAHPIQENSLKWIKKWGEANNVTITPVPVSYEVYVEKMTANLTSGGDQYDLIWHNDDWGQLWGRYLEPVDDIPALKKINRFILEPHFRWEGHDTGFPFVETMGAFFYRTDLVKESELPHTWAQLVQISQRLQKEGKVKWGFVGGMKYPHSWFTFFWSIWGNGGDFFLPVYERDNAKLAANGWKTGMTEPAVVQAVEFWWDAIHKYKIVPPGQPTYTRTDANAIFMAGDSAFTMADTTFFGEFNNPEKSKVAGKVSVTPFIMGPSAKMKSIAWRDPWGWAIPKSVAPEKKKLAKEMLNWLTLSKDAQVDLWKQTGGIPPNEDIQKELMKEDPMFQKMIAATSGAQVLIHGALYFPRWPEVYATEADYLVRAVTGPRESIKKTLEEAGQKMREIAMRQ